MSRSDFSLPHNIISLPHNLAQDAKPSFFASNPLISLMFFSPHNLAQHKTPMIIMCMRTHTQERIELDCRFTCARLCGDF